MTRWQTVLASLLILGGAGVYYGLPRLPKAAPATAKNSGRLACRFAAAEKLVFTLHTSASVQQPDEPAPQRLDLDALMWWRIVEDRGAGGWVVAAQLDKVRVQTSAGDSDPADSAPFSAPFVFQIGTDCRFRDLAFRPDTPPAARQKLERLVRAMEIILSPLPGAQWVAQHRDELGTASVSYAVDRSAALPLVTLRRLRYASAGMPWLPQLGGRLGVDILASQGQASLDPDGRWLRALDDRQQLRVTIGTRQLSETATTLKLTRIEPTVEPPASLAQLQPAQFVVPQVTTATASTDPRELPPADPGLLAMDVNAALADFASLLSQGREGLFKATERLASYLAARPQAVDELVQRIRSGSIDGKLHSALFLALERTGTLAAERGLAASLADRAMTPLNRMRAAAALQDLPKPTANTARTLIDQARVVGGGADEQQVASAALLALGALSHRVLAKQPALAQLARDEIGSRLRATHAPGELAVVLDAVGNSGDKELTQVLKPYTQDDSAAVRAHAAQAYRRMPVATMEPVLADWLGREPEPKVRGAISSALNEGLFTESRAASSSTVAAAVKQLATEADTEVRASLINLLGTAAATDPTAKQALIEQFSREPAVDLKVLIGRFVSASDLH